MDKYHILILIIFTIVHISSATASTDLSVCDIHRIGDDLSVSVLNNGSNTTARLTVYAVAENNALVESLHPYPAEGVHHCNETWNITHPGAVRMRIHFSEIEVYGGVDGRDRLIVENGGGGFVCAYVPVKIPGEQYKPCRASDVHTPWVAGDMVRVVLNITDNRTPQFKTFGFCIDGYDTYGSSVPIYEEDIYFGDYELKSILIPTDRDYIVAIIDEENNINETNETNNELTRKLSPEITGVTFDPETPLIGNAVTISAGVRNPGTATTTDILLRIDGADASNTTLPIAHNETGTAVFHWTATVGCHNITIVTDDDDDDDELDDVLCVYHSDLLVTDLAIESDDPRVMGDPVTLATDGVGDIIVYDWGTVPYYLTYQTSMPSSAGHCWTLRHPGADWIRLHFSHLKLLGDTRLTISNGTYTESYGYHEASINNFTDILTPEIGGDNLYICLYTTHSANLTIDKYEYRVNEPLPSSWSAYPAGPHNITAVVNENESIPELNFTNNRLSKEILVEGCDLSISHIDITPEESMRDDEPVEIDVTVRNIGVMSVTSDVSFLVDNKRIDLREITLAAGESTTLTTTWTAVANTHEIRVVADADDNVSETDETNNEHITIVEVAGADFSVPAITADPETIIATIRNTGSASDARIDVYDCTFNGTYSYSDVELIDQNTTMCSPGAACVCVNFTCLETTLYVTGSTGAVKISEPGWVAMPGDTISLYMSVASNHSVHADFYAGPLITSFDDETIGRNESLDISTCWTPDAGRHVAVVYADPGQVVCETDEENNFGVAYIYIEPTVDFAVTGVHIDPPDVVDGDSANITVSLNGTADSSFLFTMEDHLTRNLAEEWYGKSLTIAHGNDAIRVHFRNLSTPMSTYLNITDASGDLLFSHTYNDRLLPGSWSSWICAETINIVKAGDFPIVADIDRYECKDILRDMTVSVVANVTAEITTTWQASTGSHKIHAEIISGIEEINVTNNCVNKLVSVKPSRDPAVLNITYDPIEPENGDVMLINAEIANTEFRQSDCSVEIWDTAERNFTIKANDFFEWYTRSWRIPGARTRTGIGADMTGVHFESIDTDVPGGHSMHVYDAYGVEIADFSHCKRNDLWVWGEGDFLTVGFRCKNDTMPVGFRIDRYAHKKLLNRTTTSLDSGEAAVVNASMNATTGWHVLEAVIDPEDCIDEINESNNLLRKPVWVKGPDITPASIRSEGGKISAVIRNIGDGGAENVTVSFCREVNRSCIHKRFNDPVIERIDHTDATRIRVRFKDIKMYGNMYLQDENGAIVDEYSGKSSDIWTQWVHGDTVQIVADAIDEVGVPLSGFEIDRYEYEFESKILDLDAHNQTLVVGAVACEYEEPYNLSVWVDVDDNILESDEDNNDKRVRMGADIAVIRVVIDPEAPIMGDTCQIKEIANIGNLPTPEFDVMVYINATNKTTFRYNKTIAETITLEPDEIYGFSWETPEVEPPDDVDYDIRIVTDPEDVVKELDEANNNVTGRPATVYSHTNYTGGELYLYETDWVYGNIRYTIGDCKVCKSGETYAGTTWGDYKANFEDVIPEDMTGADIKLARLYLYWTGGRAYSINESKYVPLPIEADVEFNGVLISEDRRYIDCPHATREYDVAWGTYTYEIPSGAVKSDNSVVVDRSPFKNIRNSDPGYRDPYEFGIFGVGLIVVYESDEGVLTNYWINEGGDVVYEGANSLGIEDMATTAVFDGKIEDKEMTNATLWTAVPHGGESSHDTSALYFNGKRWGNVWDDGGGIDHRHVTEHLLTKDNTAKLQYISGTSMMSSNAFLFVRYPPDLAITNLTAPDRTVVGAHHSINVTIINNGRSDAHNFNVTFYIGKKQMVRIPHLDLPAGNATTLHLYNWTPKMLGYVYNLTVAADVLSGEDWTEVETENNAMTRRVLIEEGGFGNQTGPRGIGGGAEATGGEFTEEITGRVMQGMKEFLTLGGGGGAGMFSLTEWIMKSVVWSVLILFVCLGYWVEGRSLGRVNRGLQQPY
ncbi:MAG: CARDB domain-containing protein [Euryarchaeota archaeon]|nr:CARDB domain-containing protein [Euryarchaeota archaeon]